MNATARIVRQEQTPDGALGTLSLMGQLLCNTLEPDNGDQDRNQIPSGTYYCQRRDLPGAKFPHTFEIMVPGHTNVLYHWGNIEDDTTMCVILGVAFPWQLHHKGKRAVFSSRRTFDIFMLRLREIDWFYTEFINRY